jgi:hypothetical protein
VSPKRLGTVPVRPSDRGDGEGVWLCLPWDSFFVSNDCLKIERTFELRQGRLAEKRHLWRNKLHVESAKSATVSDRLRSWFFSQPRIRARRGSREHNDDVPRLTGAVTTASMRCRQPGYAAT